MCYFFPSSNWPVVQVPKLLSLILTMHKVPLKTIDDSKMRVGPDIQLLDEVIYYFKTQ